MRYRFILSFIFTLLLTTQAFAFRTPESVAYDQISERYFVSNLGTGSIDEIDQNGNFLRTIAQNGKNGLTISAPTGITATYRRIGFDGDFKLYLAIADSPFVRLVDVSTGKEAKSWNLSSQAKKYSSGKPYIQLNDIAADGEGNIFVSDQKGGQILRVNFDQLKPEVESIFDIQSPNGIIIDRRGELFVVTDNYWLFINGKESAVVFRCNIESKDCTPFVQNENFVALDGITQNFKGDLILSDWYTGQIFQLTPDGNVSWRYTIGVDDQGRPPNPADITVNNQNKLLVPLSGQNKVLALDLDKQVIKTTSNPWMLVGKWTDLNLLRSFNHPLRDSSWEIVSLEIISTDHDWTPGLTKLNGTITLGCKLPKDPMDFQPECYRSLLKGVYDSGNGSLALTLQTPLPYFGDRLDGFFDLEQMTMHINSENNLNTTFNFTFTPDASNTKVIAHRGDSDHYPENTLLSITKAIEYGADIIELDVHLTKDGVPVVLHDPDVSRTTNGTGDVKNWTLEDLKKLSAGFSKMFGDKFKDEKVPTLREIFEASPNGQVIFVEIKKGGVRSKPEESVEYKALELAREFNRLNSTVFISFEELPLKRLLQYKQNGELIRTGFIASPWSIPGGDPIKKAQELQAEWAVLSREYRQGNSKTEPETQTNPFFGRDRGSLKLAFWTFSEPHLDEALQFLPGGVDALTSNSPKETLWMVRQFRKAASQ